jgi:hypothetical protein
LNLSSEIVKKSSWLFFGGLPQLLGFQNSPEPTQFHVRKRAVWRSPYRANNVQVSRLLQMPIMSFVIRIIEEDKFVNDSTLESPNASNIRSLLQFGNSHSLLSSHL